MAIANQNDRKGKVISHTLLYFFPFKN